MYEKESVIIFDEVQLLPKARQAIKYLVADGRYKYIETGSLISIKKNTKDILQAVDVAKRAIVDLYEEDFTKIDSSGLAGDIYDAIPANLSGNASRYVLASAR